MKLEQRFAHKIKKRTRSIYYEGDKYHRRCMYKGDSIYIVSFLGVDKVQIEFSNGEQEVVNVDNSELNLIEYKS